MWTTGNGRHGTATQSVLCSIAVGQQFVNTQRSLLIAKGRPGGRQSHSKKELGTIKQTTHRWHNNSHGHQEPLVWDKPSNLTLMLCFAWELISVEHRAFDS